MSIFRPGIAQPLKTPGSFLQEYDSLLMQLHDLPFAERLELISHPTFAHEVDFIYQNISLGCPNKVDYTYQQLSW